MRHIPLAIVTGMLVITLGACTGGGTDTTHTVTLQGQDTQIEETATEGDPYIPEWDPGEEDDSFEGWYLDEAGTLPAAFGMTIDDDMTLYARYDGEDDLLEASEIEALISARIESSPLYDVDEADIEAIAEAYLDERIGAEDALVQEVLDALDSLEDASEERARILSEAAQSVALVDTYQEDDPESGGSAVLYARESINGSDESRYFLLTNEHVTTDFDTGDFELTFFLEDTLTIPRDSVTLHGASVEHDLAVLSFEHDGELPLMEFADTDTLTQGQSVYAIGSPLDLPNTVTDGILSHVERPMEDEFGMDTITLQHTASINSGNSGGALLNTEGKLVGVNVLSYVDEYVGEGIEGLHFAVRIDKVKEMLPTLE